MRLDGQNISVLEVWWTVPAALAFLGTLAMSAWAWDSFAAIRAKITAAPDRYRSWGPRWKFSLFLLGSMVCFAVGWLGYGAVGVLAMLTPPPQAEVNRTASEWFAWLLICMEIAHAVAQGLLWAALRSLAAEPLIPPVRRAARR